MRLQLSTHWKPLNLEIELVADDAFYSSFRGYLRVLLEHRLVTLIEAAIFIGVILLSLSYIVRLLLAV